MVGKPFVKGQSGNPGGRPKEVAEVRDLARQHTAAAIGTLAKIMNDTKARESARVAAADALLDRGWGKAPAHLSVTHDVAEMTDAELIALARSIGGGRASAQAHGSLKPH